MVSTWDARVFVCYRECGENSVGHADHDSPGEKRNASPPVIDADWDMSHRTLKIALFLALLFSLALWALSYFHVSYCWSAGQRFYVVSVSRGCFVLGGASAGPISRSQWRWSCAGFSTHQPSKIRKPISQKTLIVAPRESSL